MFAIIAAVLFGFALLLSLLGTNIEIFTVTNLMLAGFLFLALHFTGAGTWRGRGYRGRRPGPG
jgi:hypothetical protein